jgi:hypothetical protein
MVNHRITYTLVKKM